MKKTLTILLLTFGVISLGAQEYQLSKPLVKVKENEFFKKKASITLDFRLEGASIHYTLDGSEPTKDSKKYQRSLKIRQSSVLKLRAFKAGFIPSETVSTHLLKVNQKVKSITISPNPSPTYKGHGGATLIDQKAGGLNFRDSNWLGYNEGPISMVLDFEKQIKINQITVSTLNSPDSWIMPPKYIQGYISTDGITFKEIQTLNIRAPQQGDSSGKVYYELSSKTHGRYIKLIIQPLEKLPEWHAGQGNSGWLFLDEILVN